MPDKNTKKMSESRRKLGWYLKKNKERDSKETTATTDTWKNQNKRRSETRTRKSTDIRGTWNTSDEAGPNKGMKAPRKPSPGKAADTKGITNIGKK